MATISTLTFGERVALPFCTVIPIVVGIIGYIIWKRDRKRDSNDTMTDRMRMWFMGNFAAMSSIAIFHVIRTLMFAIDYRYGMGGFALSFVVFVVLSIHLDFLRIHDDQDLLLNSRNETSDFVLLDNDALAEHGSDINETVAKNRPRKYIAVLTYAVIVFQSGFDGLVLKYNPNAQASEVQIVAFFVSKLLESVVISTALIHAVVSTKWYIVYMFNFTVAVALSTLAAYEIVSPLIIVATFEHPVFQAILGGSGGILLCLSYYFSHLESKRIDAVEKSSLPLSIVFSLVFVAGTLTGMFG